MSFNTRDTTQGGQVIKYMITMFIQIVNIVSYWSILLGGITFGVYMAIVSKWIYTKHALMYFYVKYIAVNLSAINQDVMSKLYEFEWVNAKGQSFTVSRTYEQLLNDEYFQKCYRLLQEHLFWGLGLFILIFFGVMMIALWFLGREGRKQRENKVLGGRYLASSVEEVNKILKKSGKLSPFKIGKLSLVKNSEIQNIAVHGSVGTGKSTLFNDFLTTARGLSQRALVYDRGCNFIPMFYRDGKDVILNPMDSRCPNWDLWEECKDKADLENFAIPLLPEAKGGDPFWVLSARSLFVSTAEAMRKDDDRTIRKLLDALLSIPLNDLREYIEGTDAASLVEGSIEKTAITIRTVLGSYARALRVCQGLEERGGEKFAISDWVKRDNDAWIFLSSDGRVHESIKPLITAWLNVAMQNVLALKPDLNRRVWTILDELNSLQKLPMILEYLSEARKFGGASVLGLQSFAQLENNYGREAARAIWDLMNTTVYFRAPSGEIAEWVRDELGEIQHLKFKDQYSYGVDTIRDGVNFAKEDTREHIVSYSDIQNLNDLECYVSLLGNLPVVKVKLDRKNYPLYAEGKLERDMSAVFDRQIDEKIEEATMENKADKLANRILNKASQPTEADNVSGTSENRPESENKGGSEVILKDDEVLNELVRKSETEAINAEIDSLERRRAEEESDFNEHKEANINSVKHKESKEPERVSRAFDFDHDI